MTAQDHPNPRMNPTIPHAPATSQVTLDATIRTYLENLVRVLEPLPFGHPIESDRDVSLRARRVGPISIQQVWVPRYLSSTDTDRADEPTQSLSSALAGQSKRTTIVGEPGSGKSAICNWLAITLAEAALSYSNKWMGMVPILLRLSYFGKEGPWSSVAELVRISLKGLSIPVSESLVRDLENLVGIGKAYFILDGLDEVGDSHRPNIVKAITRLSEQGAGKSYSILATCRVYDYEFSRSQLKLPLKKYYLLPLTDDQLFAYIARWHEAAEPFFPSGTAASERQADVEKLINENTEVRELARIPLLAALVCMLGAEIRDEEVTRATLYSNAIRYLLADKPAWRETASDARTFVSADRLQRIAQRIALRMQEREAAEATQNAESVTIDYRDLQHLVEDITDAFSGSIGEVQLKQLEVAEIMGRLVGETSNGICTDMGGLKYKFAHKSFQEMLIALELASGKYMIPDLAKRALIGTWRETFRLLALYASGRGQTIAWILTLIQELASLEEPDYNSDERDRGALVAGEMLAEIGRKRLSEQWPMALEVVSGQRQTGKLFRGLWLSVRDQIWNSYRFRDDNSDERVRALEIVGFLGDPRFVLSNAEPRDITGRAVAIGGGRFRFGMDEPISFSGPKKIEAWPRRTLDMQPFRIARYPVTNWEYELFIRAGGYLNADWWTTHDARAWVTRDAEFMNNLIALWVEQYPVHYYKDEENQLIGAMTPRGAAERMLQRNRPYYWDDSRFNAPNYPVVGVNWWEASAYCAWLTEFARVNSWIGSSEVVRLPTEWEWEAAAGRYDLGRNTRYPWGDVFDPSRCHTRFDSLNRLAPLPVGFFEKDENSQEPADMMGNVWEWVSSRCLPYSVEYDKDRELPDDVQVNRIVRGSSWYSTEEAASLVRFRLNDQVCNAYWDLGFRYVIA